MSRRLIEQAERLFTEAGWSTVLVDMQDVRQGFLADLPQNEDITDPCVVVELGFVPGTLRVTAYDSDITFYEGGMHEHEPLISSYPARVLTQATHWQGLPEDV